MKNLKILIADDDKEKIQEIENCILDIIHSSKIEYNISFEYSYSIRSTSIKISKNSYNLLILDMSMPSFDQINSGLTDAPKALAGKEIMMKMRHKKINTPVIIVTQFDVFGRHNSVINLDNLMTEIKQEFIELYSGHAFYDPQSTQWKTSLKNSFMEAVNV